MSQEPGRRSLPAGNHNWPLMRQVVGLLRKSEVGLTPSTLLELIEETNPSAEDDVSRRGNYQRVLRALQQLEAMGLVQRAGRRYLLQDEALDAVLRHQAREAVQQLLDIPFLAPEAGELQTVLIQALKETLAEATPVVENT